MNNSVQYLTYEDYEELGGNTLNQASFNLLEQKARKQIDYYSYNRLMNGIPADIEYEIQLLMFRLINMNEKFEKELGKKNETIDGYSVGYSGATGIQMNSEIESVIKVMLSGLEVDGVPLTYSGGANDNKHTYYNLP